MTVLTQFVGVPRYFAWQNTEFTIAAVIKALREMAGRDFRPTRVTFTLAHTSELLELEILRLSRELSHRSNPRRSHRGGRPQSSYRCGRC
jgi:hypothetical protein